MRPSSLEAGERNESDERLHEVTLGVNDVVGIRYGDYMAICVEKAWTMTMGIGGTMQHTLERVIINAE